jgi:hypothetical protein
MHEPSPEWLRAYVHGMLSVALERISGSTNVGVEVERAMPPDQVDIVATFGGRSYPLTVRIEDRPE